MSRTVPRAVLALVLSASFANAAAAGDKAGAEKAAREVVAKFRKGDPGWKTRMTGLVELARQGPATVPVLIETLTNGSAAAREFAAQGLVIFADPRARPALEQALDHPATGVRIHAMQALSMLGPLKRTPRNLRILNNDPSRFGAQTMMQAALTRDDKPDAAALRQALVNYDLRQMDSARLGEAAPDFVLTDFTGKPHRLSDFRGKKTVVLRFILFDF